MKPSFESLCSRVLNTHLRYTKLSVESVVTETKIGLLHETYIVPALLCPSRRSSKESSKCAGSILLEILITTYRPTNERKCLETKTENFTLYCRELP